MADQPANQPRLSADPATEAPLRQPAPARDPRASRSFDLKGRSLREHAARGTMINTGFLVGLSALGLVRGFVLAGFLTTADFGVWGVLIVSLGMLLWLKQVGIGDKYIQQDEEDQELAFQKAFTLELAFTGILMCVIVLLLPVVALVYGEWKLVAPGVVLVAVLPAGALQAPLWVYTRNMNFFRQRLLQAADPIVGFVVAVALAAAGAGYWALAWGVLAGAWSAAALAVAFSPYKLRLRYEPGTLRSYASFPWPLFVASGATMLMAQAAVLSTSARLGLAGAGAMTLAYQITAFTNRVDELVTGTLYPAIAAVRNRLSLLQESFVKSNRLALIWAMPFGTALTLFAADLVDFGLGDRWKPAVILLQVYGVTAALGHIGFNWDAYMRATARTRPLAVANVASLVVFLAAGIPLLWVDGLRGLAIGIALQAFTLWVCRAYYLRQLFHGFSYVRHAARAVLPTFPAIATVLVMRVVEHGERSVQLALAELAAYVVVTLAATWWLERPLVREALSYLFPRRSRAAAATS